MRLFNDAKHVERSSSHNSQATPTCTRNNYKGRFPRKMQPGKPFLKQQQHNNVVEATRHSKQQRVQENNTPKVF